MELTTAIYGRVPVLVNKSDKSPVAAWPIKYSQMINMASDSHLFRSKSELETKEGGWHVGNNRWQSKHGTWVPLYEGKMVQAYDHRAAGVVSIKENLNHPGQPLNSTVAEKIASDFVPTPRYWINAENVAYFQSKGAIIAFKDITASTNMRTMIATALPSVAAGHKLPFLYVLAPFENESFLLLANLNALVFDYLSRQKMNTLSFALFILEQLPVIPPAAYDRKFGPTSAANIVKAAVLELTYTAHDMAPFARDMGHVDKDGEALPPFIWDEERRLHLRAKLDALYFILYGVFDPADPAQSRDDIRYIYSTFPIVERQETATHRRLPKPRPMSCLYQYVDGWAARCDCSG